MATQILIVEDEVIVAEDLKTVLQSLGYTVSGVAYDYAHALRLLEEKQPDVAIVDVQLGELKDGIDLAAEIKEKYNVPILFLTSNADIHTVQRAREVAPAGYVLKPWEKRALYAAIEMAVANTSEPADESPRVANNLLFVKEKDQFIRLEIDQLIWLKAEGNYTELHTQDKRHVVRGKLKELLDMLGDSFIRIHRSHGVHLKHIQSFDSYEVVAGDQRIPLGESYRSNLTSRIDRLS